MPLYGMHDQPARARSFGERAEAYDRGRADYPDALAEDLLAGGRRRVLDVGTGTGKAARLLARHGADVLGVEPDERMAEVARGTGIETEVAAFEDWEAAGRRFDLITCASAWHWLDPGRTLPRIPQLLVPGGLLARMWNIHVFDPEVLRELDAVYAELAPAVESFGHDPTGEPEPPDPFHGVPGMAVLPSRAYRWTETLTAGAWTDRIATYSGHRRLGPEALAALQARVAAVIDGFGGTISARMVTFCQLTRRD